MVVGEQQIKGNARSVGSSDAWCIVSHASIVRDAPNESSFDLRWIQGLSCHDHVFQHDLAASEGLCVVLHRNRDFASLIESEKHGSASALIFERSSTHPAFLGPSSTRLADQHAGYTDLLRVDEAASVQGVLVRWRNVAERLRSSPSRQLPSVKRASTVAYMPWRVMASVVARTGFLRQ